MCLDYFITDIKDFKSKRKIIYINYEIGFALYPSEIRKYEISKGNLLSHENYREITEELLVKRARMRALGLLKSKDYSVNELRQKLKDTYYPDSAIENAISYVSSYGYLNDTRYVENYMMMKGESKSRRQIEFFLHNKGIDKDLIKTICDRYYEEHQSAELTQAVSLIRRKLGLKDIQTMEYKEKSKLSAYLFRNGFSMDIIRKALDIVVHGVDEW